MSVVDALSAYGKGLRKHGRALLRAYSLRFPVDHDGALSPEAAEAIKRRAKVLRKLEELQRAGTIGSSGFHWNDVMPAAPEAAGTLTAQLAPRIPAARSKGRSPRRATTAGRKATRGGDSGDPSDQESGDEPPPPLARPRLTALERAGLRNLVARRTLERDEVARAQADLELAAAFEEQVPA